jgi:hypothetical protein
VELSANRALYPLCALAPSIRSDPFTCRDSTPRHGFSPCRWPPSFRYSCSQGRTNVRAAADSSGSLRANRQRGHWAVPFSCGVSAVLRAAHLIMIPRHSVTTRGPSLASGGPCARRAPSGPASWCPSLAPPSGCERACWRAAVARRMCSRPYSRSAAKWLCARQRIRRFSGSLPPPLPRGWRWTSSSQALALQRCPSALTHVQRRPSRWSTSRREARGTQPGGRLGGANVRGAGGQSGVVDPGGTVVAVVVVCGWARRTPAPNRRRNWSAINKSSARDRISARSPLGWAWRSRSRACSSFSFSAASAVSWIL